MPGAAGPHPHRAASAKGTLAEFGGAVLDLDVPARTDAIAAVRHAVAGHLTRRGVASTIVDDMELVASELLTNAITHAHPIPTAPAVDIRVQLTDDIEMIVANWGSVATIPPVGEWQCAPPFSLTGRGLGIVRRLCDTVRVEQFGGRAVITCHRRLPDGGSTP